MKIIYIACILVLIALMLVAFYYFMDLNRQNYTAFDKGILKNSDNKTIIKKEDMPWYTLPIWVNDAWIVTYRTILRTVALV